MEEKHVKTHMHTDTNYYWFDFSLSKFVSFVFVVFLIAKRRFPNFYKFQHWFRDTVLTDAVATCMHGPTF